MNGWWVFLCLQKRNEEHLLTQELHVSKFNFGSEACLSTRLHTKPQRLKTSKKRGSYEQKGSISLKYLEWKWQQQWENFSHIVENVPEMHHYIRKAAWFAFWCSWRLCGLHTGNYGADTINRWLPTAWVWVEFLSKPLRGLEPQAGSSPLWKFSAAGLEPGERPPKKQLHHPHQPAGQVSQTKRPFFLPVVICSTAAAPTLKKCAAKHFHSWKLNSSQQWKHPENNSSTTDIM